MVTSIVTQDMDLRTLNIPQEMKDHKQWLLWNKEPKKDSDGNIKRDDQGNIKYTKVPKRPNVSNADKTNPDHYISFQEAVSAYENGGFSGIGFVFTENDPFVGIDLDDCFQDGELTEKAKKIVDSLASYTEVSQSGNGLHIIVDGPDIDGFNNQSEGVEMYSKVAYFAMTGDVLRDDLTDIEERHVQVLYIHDKYRTRPSKQTKPVNSRPQLDSDDHILIEARNASNGEKFKALFDDGDISGYPSKSEADLGLAGILSFWSKNIEQIERLMKRSALYRADKYDRSDYLRERTIPFSLSNTTEGYRKERDFALHVKNSAKVDLQKELKERRSKELALMEKAWKENDSQGRKPTTISPLRCAVVLQEYISFALFDLEENTKVAMYMPNEGIYTRNTTLIKRVISWLEPKHNSSKADDVIYYLTNMAEVREKTESRYLIPVENGIFNLKTKTLEPFSPDYVFTAKISTPYVEQPEPPVIDDWDVESWMNSIACDDPEIVHLLWQVINDSLNGNYSRKKSIFLVGEGNNGKGTFQELITNLIGSDNIATLKVNQFDEEFMLSALEGKTAVIGDDVPANVYIDDSSNFNSVVTGDRVQVNVKNKQPYNTVYKCSVIQSTNGMPKFRNKTNGTIRRIVIVPFNADFDGQQENENIKEDYIRDEQVLQYVLHRAINMDFKKFDIPAVSQNELEVFKQDNDPVLDFKVSVFDEWNIPKVPKYIVYGFYKDFCENNGYKALSDRQFNKQFKTYLGKDWDTESQGRFDDEYIGIYFHTMDLIRAGLELPDGANKKAYENVRAQAVQV
ncbi:phage/plasmid primase, P4 family [Salicibibacter kimchii]|uniref:DNA primase n=1 Tax=Salicibibacter kimchii TaxID=2099786 RepID=A0A345C2I1_9BACI|nr:phage/plasmid primase, P4 family [Salicibibacter kimchii]AXF57412.1 DNA primase [Salicibibacter kimchii]